MSRIPRTVLRGYTGGLGLTALHTPLAHANVERLC